MEQFFYVLVMDTNPGPVHIPMAVVSRCRLAKNCDVEDFQDVICIAKVR